MLFWTSTRRATSDGRPYRDSLTLKLRRFGTCSLCVKNTGRRITCEGKRRPRTVSSMRHLLSKCGMPVRLRRSHGCVDEVFGARLARQRRKTLALRLFAFDTSLQSILHTEDAPRAGQRTAQSRLVIEIALDHVDAVAPASPPARCPACASVRADGTRCPAAPAPLRRPDCLSLQ